MPNRRHDRQSRVKDYARHHLFVKGPQILQAAAPAGNQDQVDCHSPVAAVRLRGAELIEQLNCRRDFLRRPFPLHAARRQNDLQRGVAALDHMQHVANGRASG